MFSLFVVKKSKGNVDTLKRFYISINTRDDLSPEEQRKAEVSALSTAKYLWNFLSGIAEKHNIPRQVAA